MDDCWPGPDVPQPTAQHPAHCPVLPAVDLKGRDDTSSNDWQQIDRGGRCDDIGHVRRFDGRLRCTGAPFRLIRKRAGERGEGKGADPDKQLAVRHRVGQGDRKSEHGKEATSWCGLRRHPPFASRRSRLRIGAWALVIFGVLLIITGLVQ